MEGAAPRARSTRAVQTAAAGVAWRARAGRATWGRLGATRRAWSAVAGSASPVKPGAEAPPTRTAALLASAEARPPPRALQAAGAAHSAATRRVLQRSIVVRDATAPAAPPAIRVAGSCPRHAMECLAVRAFVATGTASVCLARLRFSVGAVERRTWHIALAQVA